MSFSPNSSSEMGKQDRPETPEDEIKLDPALNQDEDVPLDLSMPRFPNTIKVPCPRNSYYTAVRNKPPPSYDVDANDQPIDYSKKSFTERESKVDPYGDYAETDLDQPTDYSLRYAEDDTDDEEKQTSTYFTGNEQEDTVKTYCTEGTPYETPLNFSTATSMSDLRLEESKDAEATKKLAKKLSQESQVKNIDEQIVCTKEKEETVEISTKESKNLTNELVLNSSSASIEKPVNYYEEGTPGRISRVSSLSSLGDAIVEQSEEVEVNLQQNEEEKSIPDLPVSPLPLVEENNSREEVQNSGKSPSLPAGDDEGVGDEAAICPEEGEEEEEEEEEEEGKGEAVAVDKEGKVVTFGGEDHYAEQTPLMFSRSSSLGSLSGFEQQSIHDDRSSIVSDFSRRTSGVVSPSELPDSPSQTVPPSPRHNQRAQSSDFSPQAPPPRQFHYVKNPRAKCSVFEDNIAAFKEESTPIEFSAATSLSSLTIDDEPKILIDSKENPIEVFPEKARTLGRSAVSNNAEVLDRNGNQVVVVNANLEENRDRENFTDQVQVSDGDEDDEDILAACISIGMRTSMYREPAKKLPDIKEKPLHRIPANSATNLVRYQTSSTLDRLEAGSVSTNSTAPEISSKIPPEVVAVPTDTVHIYCTEDTPADISPVGSQSNLSALSMSSIHGDLDKDERNRLSGEEEDNWILTGDDEKILEECILSGIPKAAGNNNCLPGAAVAPQDFHSPSRISPMRKSEVTISKPSNARGVSSAPPPPALIENNEIPIHRTSFNTWRDPAEPSRRAVHRSSNPYNDSSNQTDDAAILGHCTQSSVPKPRTNSLPFVSSTQRPRKPTKPPSRRPRTSDGSSHTVTQVYRGNVTRITITQSHEPEELFTDSSSNSDEEEDLILAQCIRSGMPKA